ncbi:MAG: hypothetical protein K2X82_25170, partial [Gemmataceae bacterium]|nr:hypothetical protein [Gemmataceae bacterium]
MSRPWSARSWWQKLFARPAGTVRRPPRPSARPRLWLLEDRTAPARSILVDPAGAGVFDPAIAGPADTTTDYVVSPAALEAAAAGGANLLLSATQTVRFAADVDLSAAAGLSVRAGTVLTVDPGLAVLTGPAGVTLEAAEIDLDGGGLVGTGPVALRPADPADDIVLGGAANVPGKLTLTDADLAALGSGLASVAVGRPDGTGAIAVAADVALTPGLTVAGGSLAAPAGTTIT